MAELSAQWVLEDVVVEHAEEAAFLWEQREEAVRSPDYDLDDILTLDERLGAHLDGLHIAGAHGWAACKEIGWDLPGEYFTSAALAIYLQDDTAIDEVLDAAEGDRDASRAVISAFGWAFPERLRGRVKRLLSDPSPHRRRIAIGACAVHRTDPGEFLDRALEDPDADLRARAARAAAELGRVDCLPVLEAQLEADNDELRFWSAWAGVRLGSVPARRVLGAYAGHEGHPRRRFALGLVLRAMSPERSRAWVSQISKTPGQRRWALIASGMQGDPVYLPGLIGQFDDEEHARVAGESFERITGLDIFRESLEVIPPPYEPTVGTEAEEQTVEQLLEDDEDDDDEDLGEDLGLVIPDRAKMQAWFDRNGARFEPGTRFLCGRPIEAAQCLQVLHTGRQRQRIAAALELALADPRRPIFEWRAPAIQQRQALARLRS